MPRKGRKTWYQENSRSCTDKEETKWKTENANQNPGHADI